MQKHTHTHTQSEKYIFSVTDFSHWDILRLLESALIEWFVELLDCSSICFFIFCFIPPNKSHKSYDLLYITTVKINSQDNRKCSM